MKGSMAADMIPSDVASVDREDVWKRRGILFIVSAPSGAGKTTLCKKLVASIPEIWHSISYTTRKPREGEINGREYYFVGEDTFQELLGSNEFLEHAHVYGNWYGTPRKALMDKLEQGVDVLLEIDVQGALQLKKKFEEAVFIFILPPSLEVLRERLLSRASDSQDVIQRRLQKVKEEMWSFREYSYIVRNDDLEQSLRELQSIFFAEQLRTIRLNMNWFEQNFILDRNPMPLEQNPSTTT